MLSRSLPALLALCLAAFAPVASQAAVVSQYDTVFPLIYDGKNWSTLITLVNLGKLDARINLTFSTAKGYAEPWAVKLTVTPGSASGNLVTDASVTATIPPSGTLSVESSGTPDTLTRGYARLNVFNGIPVGGNATLTRLADGAVAQTLTLPLSPESERKSSLPLNLNEDAGLATELAFVSDTSYTRLDLTFRDPAGVIVLEDSLLFDSVTQLFVPVLETWPQFKSFKGSVEWLTSWPGADIYENQYLSSAAIVTRKGVIQTLTGSMTLPDNQTRAQRH